ncbi:MAG: DUF493 domain-containing protein [Planctomycetaceae bacterium]
MSLPSVELLESRHTFPCVFTFKVIGVTADNFAARVIAAVRDELRMEVDPPFSMREARNGNHISVTLEPHCKSPQQVLAVYCRLTGMNGLVMLL